MHGHKPGDIRLRTREAIKHFQFSVANSFVFFITDYYYYYKAGATEPKCVFSFCSVCTAEAPPPPPPATPTPQPPSFHHRSVDVEGCEEEKGALILSRQDGERFGVPPNHTSMTRRPGPSPPLIDPPPPHHHHLSSSLWL